MHLSKKLLLLECNLVARKNIRIEDDACSLTVGRIIG